MKNWNTLEADVNKIMNVHYTSGREGRSIDKIILHHNAGNLTVQDCWNVWQTRESSAHYQVQSDGLIGQLVWDDDTAWHAGEWEANLTSIGIEHADDCTSPWHISDAALVNGAHLVAALCLKYGLGRPQYGKNVFFHSDFTATSCPASIAGSQKDAYLQKAGEWYDSMTGTTTNKEEDMAMSYDDAKTFWGFCAPDSSGKPNNKQPYGNPYEALKRIQFLQPRVLKAQDSDSQWLFFPATGRVLECSDEEYQEIVQDYRNMGYPTFVTTVFHTDEQRRRFRDSLN